MRVSFVTIFRLLGMAVRHGGLLVTLNYSQRIPRTLDGKRLAFWMLFAGTSLLMVYVRTMVAFDAHPLFITYVWAVAVTIILRYIFYSIYKPDLFNYGEYAVSYTHLRAHET